MAAAIFFFVPLFFLRSFQSTFNLPKNLLFFSLLLVLMVGIFLRTVLEKQVEVITAHFRSGSALFVYGFFILFFCATVFSSAPLVSFFGSYERGQGLLTWIFYVLFFVCLLVILNRRVLFAMTSVIVGSGMVISIHAILQTFGFDPFFEGFNVLFFVGRAFSTLGNPDFLGQYLGPILPLAVALIFVCGKSWMRVVLGVFIPIMVYALMMSQSRAPIFGLAVSAGIFLIFLVKHRAHTRKFFAGSTIILFLAAALFFFTPLKNAPLVQRFSFTQDNVRSLNIRFLLWDAAWKMMKQKPLTGYGLDTFRLYFPQFGKPEFYALEQNINTFPDRVHDELLEFGMAGGFPAAVWYLGMIVFLLARYWFSKKNTALTHGLFLGLFVLIFQNAVSFSELPHWLLFFFFIAGIIVLEAEDAKTSTLKIPFRFGIPAFAIFMVFSGWLWKNTVFTPAQAQLHYTAALSHDEFEPAILEYKKAAELAPYSAYYWYEILLNDPASMPRAVAVVQQIEGETMNVLAWKAVMLSYQYPQQAYVLFDEIVAMNPDYPHVRQAYADALYRNKEYARAAEQYDQFLRVYPPFWRWKFELEKHSEYEKKQYWIFFSESGDFWSTLERVAKSYEKAGNREKAAFYRRFAAKTP